MTLPNVSLSITDGALGLSPASVDRVRAIVGCSSSGTANAIVACTNPQDVVSSFGYGPLPEAIAFQLQTGGGTVYGVKAATATSGSVGAVTTSPGSPVGSGTLTITGTPYDKYDIHLEITASGNNGAAKAKYSLDGGDTWSAEFTVPAGSPGTYAIANTGLTFSFAQGTGDDWIDGEVYMADALAPEPDATNVGLALDALNNDSREWRFVHIVGNATLYTGGATTYPICTTADTKMTAAEGKYRYTYAVCEARDQAQGVSDASEAAWIADVAAGLAAFSDNRVSLTAGACKLECAIPVAGRTYARRNVSWPILAQRVQLKRSEDSGFIAKTGSLPGVASLYHNEDTTPGFDDARMTTARSLVGMTGYFATHMRMMSLSTSDFRYVQHREVMDEACRIARQGFLQFLNADLRVDSVTGYIDERDALRIENYVNGMLVAGLGDEVSDIGCTVNRTDNLLSTSTLRGTVRIKPKAYAKFISVDVGFTNPALNLGAV